ncbi:MAG: hypothetical protein FWE37_06375 [Spirochaetaceae bacterium]|nr:hypothetical protein [Spirochaetaceae bacterium]
MKLLETPIVDKPAKTTKAALKYYFWIASILIVFLLIIFLIDDTRPARLADNRISQEPAQYISVQQVRRMNRRSVGTRVVLMGYIAQRPTIWSLLGVTNSRYFLNDDTGAIRLLFNRNFNFDDLTLGNLVQIHGVFNWVGGEDPYPVVEVMTIYMLPTNE